MQKSVKSPANIDAPVNKQGEPFKKKKVIIEQLTEHWSCEIHSLPDKPALCWTPIVQRPHSNCYPITSNVTAWPESCGFGLAFNGSGFQDRQAGPKPSMMAGFGSALA